ncbi:MAG TPA: GYD domain-containing protein [Methanotrichaceae archaeon]|nr:GYD domain-containing protein [Methanotrichaceae archaeon]
MCDAFHCTGKFKKNLSKEVIAENLKDIEDDMKGQVRYLDIYWTLGMYDTVVMFEAPNEKVAMNMALKRADRMDIETLVAVPADERSPGGPA